MKLGLGTARRPPDRPLLQKIRHFFYDKSDDGTVKCMARTPLSWLQIILFFTVFFTFLNFYISSWMYIWSEVFGRDYPYLDEYPTMSKPPHRILSDSLIGVHPGVNIRPPLARHQLESKVNIRTKFDLKNRDSDSEPSNDEGEGKKNMDYIMRMENFMRHYDYNVSSIYLKFDLTKLGNCSQFPYGYLTEEVNASPCVLIGLNRIWKWTPTPITESDFEENPSWPAEFKSHWDKQIVKTFVWFHCECLEKCDNDKCEEGDKEKLGEISYYPEHRGIDIDYFPYLGISENSTYHTPVVAIKLQPKVTNKLFVVECRTYYKGVIHETKFGKQMGLIQFEVILRE